MTAKATVFGRRGNHTKLVSILLVRRAAQTLSRGGTLFWNPRLRRHEREMLAFRRREDAGQHDRMLRLFWMERGRQAHVFLQSLIF